MGLFDFIKKIISLGNTCNCSIIPEQYIVFDIETTGFSRRDDRIIEIAAIKYVNGQIVDRFHSFANPGRHIPNAITRLTGITDSDVCNAPTIDLIKRDLLRFFGSSTLVGHNINSFDIPFLEAQFRCAIQNRRIDTLSLSKQTFPGLPNYKLVTLDHVLGLGGLEHHRADNDITVNNALFLACANPKQYRNRISDPAVLKSIPSDVRPSLYPQIDTHSFTPTDPDHMAETGLTGKGIVFSGEFCKLREEMYQIAVDAGAILKNHVSRKTSYLVQGIVDERFLDANGMSSKQRTANKLISEGHDLRIISEQEFLSLAKPK